MSINTKSQQHKMVRLFGINFNAITIKQAVDKVLSWTDEENYNCHYVVTPNVDHVVKFQCHDGLKQAYKDASLTVVDGKPVLWASKLFNPLPEVIPGSDLCPEIFDVACQKQQRIRIFLLGAAEGVAEKAADKIHKKWPWVTVCGCYSPAMGFDSASRENIKIIHMINELKPDLLLVGLGAPKQEIWMQQNAKQLQVKAGLCIGATIDFIAGVKPRAPKLMRMMGMEWLFRALTEPRRLMGRYLHDAVIFPQIVIKEFFVNEQKVSRE